jgi:hypothetical protein
VWFQESPAAEPEADPAYVALEQPEPPPPPAPPPAPPPQRTAYAPPAYSPSAYADEEEPEPEVRAASPRTRVDWGRHIGVAAGWVAFAALVLMIAWSGMRFRQQIANVWPKTASLYEALGRPVNTTGLAIGHVNYRNETQDGQPVLSITGRLTNITTHEILVPPLHVTLTDDEKRVLYNWSFSASVVSLKAGQSVSFVTRLSSPPNGARHLQVRLAEISK